jgi:hypothetical protein
VGRLPAAQVGDCVVQHVEAAAAGRGFGPAGHNLVVEPGHGDDGNADLAGSGDEGSVHLPGQGTPRRCCSLPRAGYTSATIAATRRRQGRLLDFLVAAGEAALRRSSPPSLLPAGQGG